MRHAVAPLFLVGLAGAILTSGCGANPTQAVQGLFKKDGATEAESKKTISRTAVPGENDQKYIEGSLEQQLHALRQQYQQEQEQLRDCEAKREEYAQRAREYSSRLDVTKSRMARLEKVMSAIETDGEAFFDKKSSSTNTAPAYATQTPATQSSPYSKTHNGVAENSIESLLTGGPDLEPPLKSGQNNTRMADSGFAVEGDTWVTSSDNTSKPPALQMQSSRAPASAPIATGNMKATKVLACEGEGKQLVIILDAGQKDGVQKGAYFSIQTKTGQKVIAVVTDVYPSCSRAVLHPQYSQGVVNLQDPATQVSSLP